MDGKQPIDADPTATESPIEQESQKVADWKTARAEWIAGISVEEIAKRHGVTVPAVYSRCRRERWPKRPKKPTPPILPEKLFKAEVETAVKTAVAVQSPAIHAAVKERLGAHLAAVLGTVETLHRSLDYAAGGRLEVEELKSLSSTLDNLDRVARRTFGLDGPSGGSPGSLLATVAPAVLCPVIEAEVAPVAPLPPPAG